MPTKSYTRTNFHRHTFCVFQEVALDTVSNCTIDYKSKSGSQYYFTEAGVYRLSNHWGRAANCKWRLQSSFPANTSRTKVGYANWSSFHADNDHEKLYFIQVNWDSQTVNYLHKDSPEYQDRFLLRTASETTVLIKNIRHLLTTDGWAKHYQTNSISDLGKQIIEKLITSNQSLAEIKREILVSL